jgi:hypothetical protein
MVAPDPVMLELTTFEIVGATESEVVKVKSPALPRLPAASRDPTR